MKKLKNENGAITMITLVSILFMVSFLISSYAIISNKVKAQKDIINQTREIYESKQSMEEIYNLYFNNGNIVPIYTVDQLLNMGTEKKNVNINGKYYDFTNDENTIYVLMNDLKFKASDYEDRLDSDGYWMPVGNRILAYEETIKSGSVEENEDMQFKARFEGKNNSIEIIYKDEENDEYSVVYSNDYNYCEPEYVVNINPVLPDGNTASEAKILKENEDTGFTGITRLKIQRLNKTVISAYLDDTYTVPKKEILIINPNKIEDLNLNFDNLIATLTIQASPENAKITINGEERNSINVARGTTVNYKVECEDYYTKQGSLVVDKTKNVSIELSPHNYIPFSEKFYFTRCSNDTYSGILNGGEATLSKYNLGGADYSMGTFYIDESDIVQKIPSKGVINKVILHFEYYQDRNNTTLYTNKIKTTLFTGDTEKMEQQESELTNKTVQIAEYELYNVSRKDLEEGLSIRIKNYIEGTLTINSSIKNMYCIIEGEKPDA